VLSRKFGEETIQVLLTPNAQKILKCRRIGNITSGSYAFDFVHTVCSTRPLQACMAGHLMQLLETHNCRLLKYMGYFSSKAIPVFALIHYWAQVNNIGFARAIAGVKEPKSTTREPAALEWLIACFLGTKKVIR